MLIPLRVDVPMWRTPWVNYGLIGLIVLTSICGFADRGFFMKLAGIERSGDIFSPVSRLTTKDYPLPVLALTSSFLHGGLIHLAGNLLFLWIFGNAINYKFGHVGYLGLYLAAAFAGGMAHYGLDGRPVVGASGAINGVMAAFLVFFPRNDITVLWLIWIRPGVSRLSSGWIILFWIAWDILFLAMDAGEGVALWAHLAGFAVGFAVAAACALKKLIRPTEDEETLFQVLGGRRRR